MSRAGRIVAVTGARAMVLLDPDDNGCPQRSPEIGALLAVDGPEGAALAMVASVSAPAPAPTPAADGDGNGDGELRLLEMELLGELPADGSAFRRGLRAYPALGDPVRRAGPEDLARAYATDAPDAIRVGSLHQDRNIPALLRMDDLLGKHFAVLGSTGTGKSCAIALILQRILEGNPEAHAVLLDVHREFAAAFRGRAEVLSPETMQLPYWLLTHEEISEVLLGGEPQREAEVELLRELIPAAKQRHAVNMRRGDRRDLPASGADAPVPYRLSDVVALLDDMLGKVEQRADHAACKRLKSRIEAISRDPRFAFMFGSLTVQDTMVQVLGRLFRLPVEGKPVTIVELGGLPSEVITVVVSVLARLAFDFGVWSGGQVPLTLICEEAHRYAPADHTPGFDPAKRALARIAREGRKYGVSLAVVTQRPAELDAAILSQCSTVFALRLSNARDQELIQASIAEAGASLMDFMPVLGTAEAIAFGEALTLPARILLDQLPPDAMPTSSTASFSRAWSGGGSPTDAEAFLTAIVQRWRAQAHASAVDAAQTAQVLAQENAAAILSPGFPERRRAASGTIPPAASGGTPAENFERLLRELRERR